VINQWNCVLGKLSYVHTVSHISINSAQIMRQKSLYYLLVMQLTAWLTIRQSKSDVF